jgi:acyl-CoA oxidase
VGDIGPKFAFETVDNGFLKLNKVRIPREQMFMKFAKVTKEGQFIKPSHDKISYATMIMMRIWILDASAQAMEIATTIAVRYSAVRRQFNQSEVSRYTITFLMKL